MKKRLKFLLVISLLVITHTSQAQKKPYYNEQEQVIEAAYLTLETEIGSGKLKEWATEKKLKGSYTFNITIGGAKGEVYTIQALARSDDGEVMQQNTLKDYLKSMRFPFKMPKDKSYQFQYEFKF